MNVSLVKVKHQEAIMEYVNHMNFQFQNTAVSLGKFDGVHIGHQKLMDCILLHKEDGLKAVVFSFLIHPNILLGGKEMSLIMTEEEKRQKLSKMGVDVLISYPFSKEMLSMEPEQFIKEILVDKLDVKVVAIGENFHFGHNRRGDAKLLKELAPQYGYEVQVFERVKIAGERVSSTWIRECIGEGNVEYVQNLLGEPYSISGEVVHGKEIGRALGMPTANVIPDKQKLLPPFGVYTSKTLVDGIWYEGITNIGVKPTITEEKVKLAETYLFDYQGNLYGKEIRTNLYYYQRPEQKFDSIEALKAQMEKDCQAAKEYMKRQHTS